mmetsp:Transcript_494/g.1179  ORF Transcript_494/g.1179 Transcript_494/m.1179 type:complete len:320 (+) Transcript_494:296-1255(+)
MARPRARALLTPSSSRRQPIHSANWPTKTLEKLDITPSAKRSNANIADRRSDEITALISELLTPPHQLQQMLIKPATKLNRATRCARGMEPFTSRGIGRTSKINMDRGMPAITLIWAVITRPTPAGKRLARASEMYPPSSPPIAFPPRNTPVTNPASKSVKPAVCRKSAKKKSAFHGMLPNAPCPHIICSVLICMTYLLSCMVSLKSCIGVSAFVAVGAERCRLSSTPYMASAPPAMTLIKPIQKNKARQPSTPPKKTVETGVATSVHSAVPAKLMTCSKPNAFPALASLVLSASNAYVAGIAVASAAPVHARRHSKTS